MEFLAGKEYSDFDNKIFSNKKLKELVLLRIVWWIKDWKYNFLYSFLDVVRCSEVLKWKFSNYGGKIITQV